MTDNKQSAQEKKFPFKVWAFVIVVGGLQNLVMPLLLPGIETEIPKYIVVLSVVVGALAVVAGVGFWLERKWGLWLYIGLLAFFILTAVIVISQGLAAAFPSFISVIFSIIFGIMLAVVFISQRHQFK